MSEVDTGFISHRKLISYIHITQVVCGGRGSQGKEQNDSNAQSYARPETGDQGKVATEIKGIEYVGN